MSERLKDKPGAALRDEPVHEGPVRGEPILDEDGVTRPRGEAEAVLLASSESKAPPEPREVTDAPVRATLANAPARAPSQAVPSHAVPSAATRAAAPDAPETKILIRDLYKIFGPDPQPMVPLVKEGVGKTELLREHGHVLGLQAIDIAIPARRVQVIMGLSGSGKSTLIRHINRLIDPTAGEIWVDGEDVLAMNTDELRRFRRRKASMVFQKFALFPHYTVADNAAYGLTVQGIDRGEAVERSQKWLERVGLKGFEDRYPAQLSGGMQQRVGLARALATDAEILLMDEAFSALDPLIRTDMQNVMLDLQEELHKTIVFITHDLDEALHIGDNIAILRDGRMVQQGSPQEIVLDPADDYVADFIKDINRGRVLEVGSVMHAEIPASGPQVDARTVIEDAMQVLTGSGAHDAVVTRDGRPVGGVSMHDMVSAIARSKGTGGASSAYT